MCEHILKPMLRPVLQSIMALRGRLHQIRYYSARRHRSAWDTVIDAALIATLLLATASVPLVQSWIVRESLAFDLSGGVYDVGSERFMAHVNQPERSRITPNDARLVVAFDFEANRLSGGWPFVSRTTTMAPTVSLTRGVHGSTLELDVSLEPGTPIRDAIEADMAAAGLQNANRHWQRNETVVRYRPLAWVANGVAWWFILLIASVLAIRFLQLLTAMYWLGQGYRSRERGRRGRCVSCGYNMYGLDFNERCPECGELVE